MRNALAPPGRAGIQDSPVRESGHAAGKRANPHGHGVPPGRDRQGRAVLRVSAQVQRVTPSPGRGNRLLSI
eukprot:10544745-Lingulodinium_polyedra.AAC.1